MMRAGPDGTEGCQRAAAGTRRRCEDLRAEGARKAAVRAAGVRLPRPEAAVAAEAAEAVRARRRRIGRPPRRPRSRPPASRVTRPWAAPAPPTRIRRTPRRVTAE